MQEYNKKKTEDSFVLSISKFLKRGLLENENHADAIPPVIENIHPRSAHKTLINTL